MLRILFVLFFQTLTLGTFAHQIYSSKDLTYFTALRKKSGRHLKAFKEVQSKMLVYYQKLEKEDKGYFLKHFTKNARQLENDPEGYAIYSLVVFDVLKDKKDRLQLTKIIPTLERKLSKLKNEKLRFHTENIIATYYRSIGKVKLAEKYTNKALLRAKKLKDTVNIQILNYNLGANYFHRNELSKAESHLRKAMYYERYGYREKYFQHRMALALILESGHGKSEEAIRIYEEIEHLVPEDQKGGFYNNLGNLLLGNAEYHAAEEKLLLAVDYLIKEEDISIELTYANLANCYEKLHDFEKSYSYLLLKDSVVKVQQREQHIALLERLKRQELVRIRKLEQKNAKTKLAYERSRSFNILILLVLALLLLGGAFWAVVSMRRKIKQLVRVNIQNMDNPVENNPEHKVKKKLSIELIDKIEESITVTMVYTDPEITIQKLATMLKTNATDLSNAINQHYNVPFRTLINTKRVELAKRMLIEKRYQNYSIEGIAQSVGYLNNSSFYKHFREITGVTPTNFKLYGLKILDEDTKVKQAGKESETAIEEG